MNSTRLIFGTILLASLSMAQNIVQNPGFENATQAPWVMNSWGVSSGSAHTGNNYVGTGCVGAPCIIPDPDVNAGWLYQDLATTPGATYTLTFYYFPGPVDGEGGGGTAELQVLWGAASTPLTVGAAGTCGGNCVYRNATIGSTTYTQVTVSNLVATSSSTRLEFLGRQDPDEDGIDDVVVTRNSSPSTPVTPVGTPALGNLGLTLLAITLAAFGARHLAARSEI